MQADIRPGADFYARFVRGADRLSSAGPLQVMGAARCHLHVLPCLQRPRPVPRPRHTGALHSSCLLRMGISMLTGICRHMNGCVRSADSPTTLQQWKPGWFRLYSTRLAPINYKICAASAAAWCVAAGHAHSSEQQISE